MAVDDRALIRLDTDALTDDEVDSILDPSAIGVPELGPDRRHAARIEELRRAIEDATGVDALILEARLIEISSYTDDLPDYAHDLLRRAREEGSLEAESEAMLAILSLPSETIGRSLEEQDRLYQRGLELAAQAQSAVLQADYLSSRAFLPPEEVDTSERLRLAWKARDLIETSGRTDSRAFDILSFSANVLAKIAWASERNDALARRYWALGILCVRRGRSTVIAGRTHLDIALKHSRSGELSDSLLHVRRAEFVWEHAEMWYGVVLARYFHARLLLEDGKLDEGKRLATMLGPVLEKVRNAPALARGVRAVLGAMIAVREGDYAGGIELAQSVIHERGGSTETRLLLMKELAAAYVATNQAGTAVDWYQQALATQAQMHEDYIAASISGPALQEQIERLRSEFYSVSETARKSEALLKAILPPSAYAEFARTGECRARLYHRTVIFYSDFAGFTAIASGMHPEQLVDVLGELFQEFDRIMMSHRCERVETIGDAYLAVAGLGDSAGDPDANLAEEMVLAALEISAYLASRNAEFRSLGSPEFMARIGVHAGSIVGGLVGGSRLRYAVFGDTVNTSQRLEAGGNPGTVTVSQTIVDSLVHSKRVRFEKREPISAKGKGDLLAWEARSYDS